MSDGSRSIVVCVPTYRRPQQLVRLLEALGRQRGVEPFDIVIGNNDDRPLSAYPELSRDDLPAYRVIQVTTRGVSAVRNALVADVLVRHREVRYLACLDDDQYPEDAWLARLIDAGIAHDADLVGGPVLRSAPAATFWSHGAADTSYLPIASGPVPMLNEAGNLLLSARFLRTLDRAPFSLDFGRTGGEDYEFFLHAKSRGAVIVWAPEARVHEPLPADRLTFRSYLWRFYAIAAYQARADRSYRGPATVIASIAKMMLKAPIVVARSLLFDRSARIVIGLIIQYAAMIAGRTVGLLGKRAERYGKE
jgi:glycosyltransferase involved in cell wall biosynthesis